jgi:sugar phosphate permease
MTDPASTAPVRNSTGQAPAVESWPVPPPRACFLLGSIVLAYIGVYLCRKNFSVAVPLIQPAFGVDKAQTGLVISYSAAAYAMGKFIFGPIIDKFGGRICLLAVLVGVAVFGALGSVATSLPMLICFYTANRFCGSAGWGSIIKLTPRWFPQRHMAVAVAFLSLSFVFGGALALVFAGHLAAWSGNNWRAVMGLPSIVLFVIFLFCWRVIPDDRAVSAEERKAGGGFNFAYVKQLLKIPQLWLVLAIAFSFYLMRETFNDWTVDFLKTSGGANMTVNAAALLSTPFDMAGALGIILLGWAFDHMSRLVRTVVLVGSLLILAALINYLPFFFHLGIWQVETAIGLIGFLSYGPYSLLAGVFAIEIGGKKGVSTVAGLVDSAGYLGTVFAGREFGKLLDRGGYPLGFHVLALATVVSAVLCLGLKSRPRSES